LLFFPRIEACPARLGKFLALLAPFGGLGPFARLPPKNKALEEMMNRVTHFDLYADDPERAADFYRTVFSWKTEKWTGGMDYWLITTGPDDEPGINGGLGKRRDLADRTTNTVEVASLHETESKIKAAGGKVLEPRMLIPGVGWFALCADTEGNRFGLMQSDAQAG
jgi:predicted enzyme related to lactoylglutathione lyase